MTQNVIFNCFTDLISYQYMYNRIFDFIKDNIVIIKNILEFNLDNFFFSNINGWKRGIETENNRFKLVFDNNSTNKSFDIKRTKRCISLGNNRRYTCNHKLDSYFSFKFKIQNDKKIKIEFENKKNKRETIIELFELTFGFRTNCNRFANGIPDPLIWDKNTLIRGYLSETIINYFGLHLIDYYPHVSNSLHDLIETDWGYFSRIDSTLSLSDHALDKIKNKFSDLLFVNLNEKSCEEYLKLAFNSNDKIKNFSIKDCKISIV